MRVLLVDDQETFLILAKRIVSRIAGFQVIGQALNGADAVRLAEELKPDLILMDVNMPVMNGFQAAVRILQQLPQTRVVMVSGHEEKSFEQRLREVKVAGFIGKTEFDASALLRILDSSTAVS